MMNQTVLGIINYDDTSIRVSGLDTFRPIPSLSFLGRYRLIDFPLSNLTNSGIKNIQVYVRSKPRSIIEHLGSGRQYNINSKQGKLRILTGEEPVQSEVYNHDITAFLQNLRFIEDAKQEFVAIMPTHIIYTVNYEEVYQAHLESKADVTVLYKTSDQAMDTFIGEDTLELDVNKRVLAMRKNRGQFKNRHISLAAYVMSKELFITLIHLANQTSSLYTLRDIIQEQCVDPNFKMIGYPIKGYAASINSIQEYARINLELTDFQTAKQLFDEKWPIYTRTNDSCPTQYTKQAKLTKSIVANGCYIEGEVHHSVIGRGVVIKPGAIIENSIVLEGSVIDEGVHLKHVVVDKQAKVSKVKTLTGTDTQVLYVKRQDRV
jgi:glucose-1-phosphate adenylyltransferase